MKLNLIPACVLATALFVASCQREVSYIPGGNPQPEIPEVPDTSSTTPDLPPVSLGSVISTSIHGRILDENGDPMQGAYVSAGNKIATTDQYGIFRIADALVPEKFTYVKAERQGYFTGSRTIISGTDRNGFVVIRMIRKKLSGSFQSNAGASIDVDNQSTIIFPADGIVTASGQSYHGAVNVFAAPINPDSEEFNEIMPGDLRGINADSQFVALKSYGMLKVELQDASGNPLQLADGKTADIRMKVPTSLQGSAPAEIPLWHFGETDGVWREEGSATLAGGWYTGKVSHFSTWNYDVPANFIFVDLIVRLPKYGVRPYSRVRITDMVSGMYSDLYTDSSGFLHTWVPRNVPVKVEILTECGGVLATREFPPMNNDTNLESIFAAYGTTTNVTGQVRDCNNNKVNEGYANIFIGGLIFTTEIVDGEYNFSLSKCGNGTAEAQLYLTNAEGGMIAPVMTFTPSGQFVDAGTTSTCVDVFTDYIYYIIDNDSIRMEAPPATFVYTAFENGSKNTSLYFRQGIYDVGVHEITVNIPDSVAATYTVNDSTNQVMLYNDIYTPVSPLVLNVEEFGAVGEKIVLNFLGTVRNDSGQQFQMDGRLEVKRRK